MEYLNNISPKELLKQGHELLVNFCSTVWPSCHLMDFFNIAICQDFMSCDI